ncbi:hypothetical protein [Corynebacterium suedekumii]|uniref:Membrane protein involved in the export of O-antigen and teichoic acid n=1 Tax=Corynebacterium suedekumii TaxID=3049801 RepID=A0ABY8VP64_9CORY|nr:hypothetical protein [Corynebacterium suedekumii]WIM70585.1 hypothetical protein QP029_01725 [Corynebacterium suedekumii]
MRSLGLATVFAGLAGFVILYVATWALEVEQADEFQAYWGLFFAATGLLDGLMQETARGVSSTKGTGRIQGGRPWLLGIWVGGATLVIAAGIGLLWMPTLMSHSGDGGIATAFFAFGLMSYAFQAVLSGVLSGLKMWRQYSWLIALDSGIRLLLALVAWQLGWGMPAFLLITIIGALSWLVILGMSPQVRARLHAPVDVSPGVLARRAGSAMLATGASAVLITGFPAFVKLAPGPDISTTVTVAGIINAVMLTRAPILVPLQRFQSALIVRFVDNREHILGALARPILAVLGLGLAGGAAAWLMGPWILATFFKPGYEVPGVILAALTFASACTGCLMITGTATLALEQHRWYVLGWVAASVMAFTALWVLPFPLEIRVGLSLIAGPVVGGLLHAMVLSTISRTKRLHYPRTPATHHSEV